jgi:hypothetical protein
MRVSLDRFHWPFLLGPPVFAAFLAEAYTVRERAESRLLQQ